jgi:peptide/nickel transport system substrate-binding protein
MAVPGSAGAQGTSSNDSVRFLTAEQFWTDWDPYQHAAAMQMRIEAQVFDYLVDFPDPAGEAVPMLATEWTPVDATTWEFKLRDGVTFHDGSTFGPEDVKASIELASGATDVETVRAGDWIPTTVEIVDDSTVRLVSEKPFAALLHQLRNTIIVSSNDLAGNAEAIKSQPNGTGPFKLVTNDLTKKVMAANDAYWAGAPKIRELVWEYVADPATRLSALQNGQAQVIDRVPPQDLEAIAADPNLVLSSGTGIESVNLWVAPGRFPVWEQNPGFRKAVMSTIDREGIVAGLVKGASTVATSFLPGETAGSTPGVPAYGKDIEAAKAMLTEAGITDGGPEFEVWVASGFLPRAEEVGNAIVSSMQEAGLHPKLVTSDLDGMIDDIFSADGTGAMYHLSWASNGDPFAAARVYSDNFAWKTGDAELQTLIESIATTTDPVERQAAVDAFQAYIWDKMYQVPLYNSDFTVAYAKDLTGLDVRPDFQTVFYPASVGE